MKVNISATDDIFGAADYGRFPADVTKREKLLS
jgi:hypothetical protein